MGTAKVLSLRARPVQASHLCFETDGILEELKTDLGKPAAPFDFPAFYAILGSAPTVPGDPSRLRYDFLAIQAFTASHTLASLRAEPAKAALDKAVNARQNAFFAKYADIPALVARINAWYSPGTPNSKPNRLAVLSALANDQANALKAAYTADQRLGVVKHTHSILDSLTLSRGASASSGSAQSTGQNADISAGIPAVAGTLPDPKPGGTWGGLKWTGLVNVDVAEATTGDNTTSTSRTGSRAAAAEWQAIVNTDYGYRMPYFESQAQNERAQISLIDQQFSQYMYSQQLPNLGQIFRNELRSLDGDVYRLQVALLNTLLMSPFGGTVTGVYKQPGDVVRAGEPVVRVENNGTINLIATLVYRDQIAIGSNVSVQTTLYDSTATPVTVTGQVISVRGHPSEDDQWEVVVRCTNGGAGGAPVIPINYTFDYDDTVVTIT